MPSTYVSEDTLPILRVTVEDSTTDNPLDLTAASAVHLRFKIGTNAVIEQPMTIDDALNGEVSYQFQAGELKPGTLQYEVRVTYNDGSKLTTSTIKQLTVRARLT